MKLPNNWETKTKFHYWDWFPAIHQRCSMRNPTQLRLLSRLLVALYKLKVPPQLIEQGEVKLVPN